MSRVSVPATFEFAIYTTTTTVSPSKRSEDMGNFDSAATYTEGVAKATNNQDLDPIQRLKVFEGMSQENA